MPPYSQESAAPAASMAPPPPPPSHTREVATGVVNLGNTCYMNAVLQALAHAPELYLAMDCEPHSVNCPIANKKRSSPAPSTEGRSSATRKSARNGKNTSPSPEGSDFCALCEVEQHLYKVHSQQGVPVAPTSFVHGFIDVVAPWFKLGVQEDSHEFLRLLIEAMQKSCTRARAEGTDSKNVEYPFQLFSGTVESNVKCESCKATSSTTDPIEDVGLEVLSRGPNQDPENVAAALQKFAKAEILEEYKCDNCGKVGKATKQSRLASIPPILTLHLKRFRYGTGSHTEGTRARSSEISQLMPVGGKSGSAKIEGHVAFEPIYDLRPFLTKSLQEMHRKMFCRLFAVIVHAGTNSHSGHYIAYVRNLKRNEWWKMDDARVSRATVKEVFDAEAYMLFYRVVEHPIAVKLKEQRDLLESQHQVEEAPPIAPTEPTQEKKRKRQVFESGEEWARSKTNMPPGFLSWVRRAEEYISENVDFKPEYFSLIMKEAAKNAGVPHKKVCADDVAGGTDRHARSLRDLLYKIWKDGDAKALFQEEQQEEKKTKSSSSLIVPVVDANEPLL